MKQPAFCIPRSGAQVVRIGALTGQRFRVIGEIIEFDLWVEDPEILDDELANLGWTIDGPR